jgi:hypothetical protein
MTTSNGNKSPRDANIVKSSIFQMAYNPESQAKSDNASLQDVNTNTFAQELIYKILK